MSKIELTYIASAINSFARVSGILQNAKKIGEYDNYHNLIQDILYRIDSYSPNCKLGTLWNALTEKSDKDTLVGLNNPDNPLMVQADSGGLQQVTLGLNITDQMKIEIFERQGEYSHYSMNFDEMPVRVNEKLREKFSSNGGGGQGLKMNHSIKYFIRELRYESGRKSGMNIKEQINVFKSLGEKCISKVMVIIQGWDIEDYNEYARGIFSVFNEMEEEEREEYYKYIGGISLGTSSVISYFQMFDLYCRAPIDLVEVPERFRSFIHILGVGGTSKSGILFALNDNFFGKEVHFSFDSTSLTSASVFGRFSEIEEMNHYFDGEELETKKLITSLLGKTVNTKVKKFVKEIQDEFEDLIYKNLNQNPLSPDEFRNRYSPWRDDGCFNGIKDFENNFDGKDGPIALKSYLDSISLNPFLHFAIEAKRFFHILDEMKSGDFHSIVDKEYRRAMLRLSKIKDYNEYMKHREWFKYLLKGKRESTMTYVQTLAEFEAICNEDYDIKDEEW